MRNTINLLFIFFVLHSCKAQSPARFIIHSPNNTPVVKINDESATEFAEYFVDIYSKATNTSPRIVTRGIRSNEVAIVIETPGTLSDYFFEFEQVDNLFVIRSSNEDETYRAIHHFFIYFANFNNWVESRFTPKYVDTISVPLGLRERKRIAFDYREPYFTDNFDKRFRVWNHTQTLDEVWGIWGHSIGTHVEVTRDMLATVNGEKTEDQFCFSSPELENALVEAVQRIKSEWEKPNRFMIMPEDNAMVCTCERCISAGNSANNASPAVFGMVNRIAKRLPEHQFFSTAYISTKTPPPFKLESNVGVMLSTMDFQKGIVYLGTREELKVQSVIDAWKRITNEMYLWDYAINFDNYLESYPTLSIQQKNLQFFYENGIKGVFMHGNESEFAAFSGLKGFVYSQLLQDPYVNVDRLIDIHFNAKYPVTGPVLADYYKTIDSRAINNRYPLDIYGNWNQALRKYLEVSELEDIINQLLRIVNNLEIDEIKKLNNIITALLYQRAEMCRVFGIGEFGFANRIDENFVAEASNETRQLINRLSSYIRITRMKYLNESELKYEDYLRFWDSNILNKPYRNRLYGKTLTARTRLDDGYPVSMLNDAAIGFLNFNDNWMIHSVAPDLNIEINGRDIFEASTISLCFLNHPRHRIYLPERVQVIVGERVFEVQIPPKNEAREPTKECFEIPIRIRAADNRVIVRIQKQARYQDLSIACDEIFAY